LSIRKRPDLPLRFIVLFALPRSRPELCGVHNAKCLFREARNGALISQNELPDRVRLVVKVHLPIPALIGDLQFGVITRFELRLEIDL
jgi:hypothetical protein